MLDFAFGHFLGLFAVAAVLAAAVTVLDRRVADLGRSIALVVVGVTLPAFALAVGFGYVENVAEWVLTLAFFYLFFLGRTLDLSP
ncbi:hypothetical protein [Halorussus aquaticus]|uniref:Uncharacterized protein n=1 Tax=Halorussus aquaticus TaxID=2953748 RepID=A0ABD5PZK1_9EURY|nr:hypothetical protein [Halorussus aquaticus]